MRNKKIVVVLALGAVAFSGGAAYSFYATSIDSSGTAGSAEIAANEAKNITATLGTAATGLVPGAPGKELAVTLTNPNAYSVGVSGKTLTLDFANATSPTTACTPAKALLSASPVTGYNTVFAAGEKKTVTFTVSMQDSTTVDQTACAGATLTIPVVVS